MPLVLRPSARAGALAALLLLAVSVAVRGAEPIPALQDEITDETGVLAGRETEIDAALDDLRERANIQLWVLFVETTAPAQMDEFAFEVAESNSMGVDDALLVVALDDRTDYIWLSDSLTEVSDAELNTIISQRLEPALGDGDFAGAVIQAADGLGDAAAAAVPPPAVTPRPGVTPQPGATPAPTPQGGGSILPLLGLLLVLGGAFLLFRRFSGWRAQRGEAEERDRRTGELAKRANQLLLQADDATNEARQELGFAEAQFSPQEVAPLREAAEQAKAETTAAFAIRQQLDDATPEDPVTREKMLGEIVARAERALALLARQRERVEQIRETERAAPEILAALPARLEAIAQAVPQATERLARLAGFAEGTTTPVAGNIVEAEKRLATAREQLVAGGEALTAGDRQAAGRAARLAQEAAVEAEQLLGAVDRLEETINATVARLQAALREADASVASARAAVGTAAPAPDQAERLRQAGGALERARALSAGARPDPLAAERLATEADRLADEVLAAAHQEAERRARAAATANGALAAAESAYTQALDFVTSRRSAMGRRARTRLVEAERHLAEARVLIDSDPLAAAQAAHRAEQLAHEALSYGQSDLQRVDPYGGQWAAGGGGIGGGSDLGSVILGGIIGGMLGGGGGRRGGGGIGWGGTPWGMPGGFGGGGGRGSGGGFNIPTMRGPGRGAGGRW